MVTPQRSILVFNVYALHCHDIQIDSFLSEIKMKINDYYDEKQKYQQWGQLYRTSTLAANQKMQPLLHMPLSAMQCEYNFGTVCIGL